MKVKRSTSTCHLFSPNACVVRLWLTKPQQEISLPPCTQFLVGFGCIFRFFYQELEFWWRSNEEKKREWLKSFSIPMCAITKALLFELLGFVLFIKHKCELRSVTGSHLSRIKLNKTTTIHFLFLYKEKVISIYIQCQFRSRLFFFSFSKGHKSWSVLFVEHILLDFIYKKKVLFI